MKIKNSFLALVSLTLFVSPVFADNDCGIPDTECCKLSKLPVTRIDYPTNLVDITTAMKTNIVGIKKELSDRLGDVAVEQMELTDEQKAKGITFFKDGYEENGSVTIGKDAQGSISKSSVDKLTSANVLRNVGVAVGTKAVAEGSSDIKNQSIAIGYCAHATNSNAIAIGGGARHADDENDLTGNNAYANGSTATAIGYSSKAIGTGALSVGAGIGADKNKAQGNYAIAVGGASQATANSATAIGLRASSSAVGATAIGPSAKATAENAVQLGTGTNSEANTLKFQGVTIVKNGYLTSGSAVPRELTEPTSSQYADQDFTVDPGSINTLLPINELDPGTEISIETKDGLRNFEVFVPNEPEVRGGLPLNIESQIADKSVRVSFVNGVKQAHRLPVKMKVTQPYSRFVLFELTEIDDGMEWQPVITNCNLVWETDKFVTSGNRRLLEGEYLNSGLTLKLAYPISDTTAVTNDIRVIEGNRTILEGTFFYYTFADEYVPKAGEDLYKDADGNTWYEIIYTTMRGKEPAVFRKEFNIQ